MKKLNKDLFKIITKDEQWVEKDNLTKSEVIEYWVNHFENSIKRLNYMILDNNNKICECIGRPYYDEKCKKKFDYKLIKV